MSDLLNKFKTKQILLILVFLLIYNNSLFSQSNPSNLQLDLSTPMKTKAYLAKECDQQRYKFVTKAFTNTIVYQKRTRLLKTVVAKQFCYVWQHSFLIPKSELEIKDKVDQINKILVGHFVFSDLHNAVPVYFIKKQKDGIDQWLIPKSLLRQVPEIFIDIGGNKVNRLPNWLRGYRLFSIELWQIAGVFILILFALCVAWLLSKPLFYGIRQITERTALPYDQILLDALKLPLILFLASVIVWVLLPWLYLELVIYEFLVSFLQSALIIIICWFLVRAVATAADALENRIETSGITSQRDRSMHTRIVVLRRVINIILLFVATGLILTRFEVLRKIGLSLLASAGIAGIILGFAAQKTFASLLAGVQLAISQPARLGDTVVIDGEKGKVEEIHLTYLVIKLWDLRRLVVPIQYFLDNSFENWTRNQPDMFATISFFADYKVPIPKLRTCFEEFVKNHKLWDGVKCSFYIQEATDRALKLRCMVSAKNTAEVGALKMDVLEYMINYLTTLDDGKYLPPASKLN